MGAFLAVYLGLFLLLAAALRPARRLARRRPGATTLWILAGALVLRLAALPAGWTPGASLGEEMSGEQPGYGAFLLYDNDIWRYLFDAGSAEAGFDPYRFSPADVAAAADAGDPRAAALLDEPPFSEVYEKVSFRRHRTVYPPAAQLLFRAAGRLAPGSALTLKALLALLDFATCLLLAGLLGRLRLPRERLLLYAWNPLAIKEIAASGHVDALLVVLLVAMTFALTSRRRLTAGLLYGAAILTKLVPLLAVPVLLRRLGVRGWLAAAGLLGGAAVAHREGLAGYLESFGRFGREWTFNTGPFAVLEAGLRSLGVQGPDTAARLVVAGLLGLLALRLARSRPDDVQALCRSLFLLLALAVVLGPVVMPWYLLWATPFAALLGFGFWIVFGAASLLSYLVYAEQVERTWWIWTQFGVLAVGAWWTVRRRAPRDLLGQGGLTLRDRAAVPPKG